MKRRTFNRYFRVFKNDTAVTEISTNDFRPLKLKPFKKNWLIGDTAEVLCAISAVKYALPTDGTLFYGYSSEAKAMQMAKAGALKYIDLLISRGKAGEQALLQYRFDHYDDLNNKLTAANIKQVEYEEVCLQLAKDSSIGRRSN
jgi:hypothetical protein